MTFKDIAWLIPFLGFFLGYQLVAHLFSVETVQAPALVGKNLSHAIHILSQINLNVRLLAQKPDADLPEGTVLSQIPEPGTKVKPRQNIFLVASKKLPALKAPHFIGLREEECMKSAHEVGIRLKTFKVSSNYPPGMCIAQVPSPDGELEGKSMIIYIAQNEPVMMIFPQFIGKSLKVAKEFLVQHQFVWQMYHTNRSELEQASDDLMVMDQKPRAGALINCQFPPSINLYVDAA